MVRYSFDLYPRTDPRDGSLVARLSDLQRAEYRGEANGSGAGLLSVRGDSSDGALIDPSGLQYVRVVSDDTDKVVGGYFLDSGDFAAINKQHTRLLTFGGAGTLSYLDREIMWSHTYFSPGGMDPFDGTWRLWAQGAFAGGDFLGAVLHRVIYEAQHFQAGAYTHKHGDGVLYTDTHADDRTESAIADAVMTFDGFEDSNGNPWSLPSGEFTAQVGESVYRVVQRLMQAGLYVEMDPDTFELNAWEAAGHRRDRTGTAFGASVVRFEAGENIKDDARRQLAAFIPRTAILASTTDDLAALETAPGDVPWHGSIREELGNLAALSQLASAQLSSRADATDTVKLRMRLGADPVNGFYRPWEEVLLDDIVTVDSGSGQWDWDEAEFPVAALEIKLREAGDWDAWAELGATYTSIAERAFQARPVAHHSHPPNPALCVSSVAFSPLGLLGVACSNSGANLVSDHPAWAGAREERVEITAAVAVPAGGSVIVITGVQQQNWNAEPDTVYDQRGNVWVKDAEHENTGSSSDDTVQIWRCNVTTAIQVGDWIRWAVNFGASLSSSSEAGGRCIGAYGYSGALTVSAVGTGAGTFGGSSSINTPAGDLVVAGIVADPATITVDGDWIAMVPHTKIAGSGDLASAVFGQQLFAAGATTWGLTFSASADWAAIAVGYSAGVVSVNDGHPDLVGTSNRANRCDSRHDVHRDRAPTVNDDWATAGYKLGTIWAQLDDLANPTSIVAVWMLIDDSTGAAVWGDWPATGGGSGAQQITVSILRASTKAEPTWDVNSTTYVDLSYLSFLVDFDAVPWTHFYIYGFGRANAAGTITFQACHTGTSPLSSGGNDVSVGAVNAATNSGWIPIAASLSGVQRLSVLIKGSTATLDFTYQYLGIMLKYEP